MSRSSKSNLIVRDDGIELLLGFAQAGNIVKNDLRFRVLLRALGDTGFDLVIDQQRRFAVEMTLTGPSTRQAMTSAVVVPSLQ